jgi:hypothetical protein
VPNNFVGDLKKSLKSEQGYQGQRSSSTETGTFDDKQHRLNFMMGKLNL